MRVALRVAAVAAGVGVALHASSHAPDLAVIRILAGAGLALLLLAVSGGAGWSSWAGVAVLGAAYAIAVAAREASLEPAAPLVGVGLYLVVELLDIAGAEPCAREVRLTRTLQNAAVACVAVILGAGLLVFGAASASTGVTAVVASAACGCVLFAGLASGARR